LLLKRLPEFTGEQILEVRRQMLDFAGNRGWVVADQRHNWVMSNLREFDGRRLQSVAQGTADLGPLADQAEAEANDQARTILSGLVSQIKAILAERAFDVRVTSRLTTSPACIVANEQENEASFAHRLWGSGLPIQPVLEINRQRSSRS
jgi:molecular chaperone HtpG